MDLSPLSPEIDGGEQENRPLVHVSIPTKNKISLFTPKGGKRPKRVNIKQFLRWHYPDQVNGSDLKSFSAELFSSPMHSSISLMLMIFAGWEDY